MSAPEGAEVPTYMGPAVLVTVLCFPPTGILALVYAAHVKERTEAGDLDGARAASRKARTWVWASVWLGLVMILLTILVGVAIALYIIQSVL